VMTEQKARPLLVIVFGLPATGKTVAAREIEMLTAGFSYFGTDTLRAEKSWQPADHTFEKTRSLYREMFRDAAKALEDGRSAVLDATFFDARLRSELYGYFGDLDHPIHGLWMHVDDAIAVERIKKRGVTDEKYSGVDSAETYYRLKRIFESFAAADYTRFECLVASSGGPSLEILHRRSSCCRFLGIVQGALASAANRESLGS